MLNKIKTQNHGSVNLVINAVAGCSKTAQAEIYSFVIPTKEGNMNITGYRLASIPAKINKNNTEDIYQAWPNLNDEIRCQALENRFEGPADILIGQDNYWTLVLEGIIKHPSEKFGLIKTKLGWTVGGRISNIPPMTWQQEDSEKADIYRCKVNRLQDPTEVDVQNSLV